MTQPRYYTLPSDCLHPTYMLRRPICGVAVDTSTHPRRTALAAASQQQVVTLDTAPSTTSSRER